MCDELQLELQVGPWTLGGAAEIHLDLVNTSRRELVLPLGHFAAGTEGAAALASCLQLQDLEGNWIRPRLLEPRGRPKKAMVMYLPPRKAIQMPIVGKVLDVGHFGGLVVRVGGESASSSEVLLPVCERPAAIPPNPRRLLRFALEAAEAEPVTGGTICWVGPHEPVHPCPRTWKGSVHSQPCEVVVRRTQVEPPTVKGHVLLQERCPLRRVLVYQHSLVPFLAHAPKRTQQPKAPQKPRQRRRPQRKAAPPGLVERPPSQGLAKEDPDAEEAPEADEPEEVPAVAETAEDPVQPPGSPVLTKPKASRLQSLSIIHHGTAWRKLNRKLDALADPILLEVAEETSRFCSESTVLALCGPGFRTRTGQRYQEATRALGFKVVTSMGSITSLYTWASLCCSSENPSDLVLVTSWDCLGSCLSILQQTHALPQLRGILVLCSHHEQDQAKNTARELRPPCPWRLIPSVVFG